MSHPSIAIWCGNNENIGALGWFEESLANPGRYLIDFDRLNNGVIASEVTAIDDTRVFWPSSPAAGAADFSDNWHDDSSGDMHYWSVWHEGKPFSGYYEVTPRFCSEFGFQSFPSLPTLRSFVHEDQLNPTSPEMEHHQRHPRGNSVILESMSRYFRVPFNFGHFVYLSQVQQAIAIQTAVTFWRSQRPVSMGALYWQLNDVWPVVSWSSVEYDGRWKLLHYSARRFFAPRSVIVVVKDGAVSVSLANDPVAPLRGTVRIRGIAWDGSEMMDERVRAAVSGGTTDCVWSREVSKLSFGPEAGFIVADFSPDGDRPRSVERAYALLTHYKAVSLAQPKVQTEQRGGCRVAVTATAAPAFWVTVMPEDTRYQPDDNGFFLLKGETREIEMRPIRGLAGETVDENETVAPIEVSVTTIRDTY
jgi:beta-mannosidase